MGLYPHLTLHFLGALPPPHLDRPQLSLPRPTPCFLRFLGSRDPGPLLLGSPPAHLQQPSHPSLPTSFEVGLALSTGGGGRGWEERGQAPGSGLVVPGQLSGQELIFDVGGAIWLLGRTSAHTL